MSQPRYDRPSLAVRARSGRTITVIGVGVAAVMAASGVQADAAPRQMTTTPPVDIGTVIKVSPSERSHPVHLALLGANHRWFNNGGGLWSPAIHAPVPALLQKIKHTGIQSARYPGGTIATLFDWKKAIGPTHRRGCQYNGHYTRSGSFGQAPGASSFGPDQYMQFVKASHTTPLLMETVVNQTAMDAADWVEYMNEPLGHGNPNGGVNYAKLRAANGHRRPYDVQRWEVGNEPYVSPTRYAESADPVTALRQYTDGGTRSIVREYLGKGCDHPAVGIRSNGKSHQVFQTLYKPVDPTGLRLFVDGRRWSLVKSFRHTGPKAHVFTLNPAAGTVRFGDGRNGARPPRTVRVRASYTNHFDGYFRFARAMKAVDPSISVCASWGTPQFARAAGSTVRLPHHPLDHELPQVRRERLER